MSLLVTGSIGIDTVETPAGRRDAVIGGSAIYFSMAASCFAPVRLVGAVGEDCPFDIPGLFGGREVDTIGLEVRKGSKTFRWHGNYVDDLNEAVTVEVDLNVLAEQAPPIPAAYLDSKYVFLANTHPMLQQEMADKLSSADLIIADTMNLWIENEKPALLALLKKIHGLVLNDGEARMLTGHNNLISAGREVLKSGLKFVVVKKGEHGSILVTPESVFVLPAYPTEKVVDPTGAGDTFAGGLIGYLAREKSLDEPTLRKAVAYGTVLASHTIADFSLGGIQRLTSEQLDVRYAELQSAVRF